jgi:hypothetical protein
MALAKVQSESGLPMGEMVIVGSDALTVIVLPPAPSGTSAKARWRFTTTDVVGSSTPQVSLRSCKKEQSPAMSSWAGVEPKDKNSVRSSAPSPATSCTSSAAKVRSMAVRPYVSGLSSASSQAKLPPMSVTGKVGGTMPETTSPMRAKPPLVTWRAAARSTGAPGVRVPAKAREVQMSHIEPSIQRLQALRSRAGATTLGEPGVDLMNGRDKICD